MSAPADFNPADLDALVDLIKAQPGISSVEIDPAKVKAPGVWVRVLGLSLEHLSGLTIRTEIVCVTRRNGYVRELTDLAAMFNTISPLLDRLGTPPNDPYAANLLLPAHPAGLPSLHIPLNLLTTQE